MVGDWLWRGEKRRHFQAVSLTQTWELILSLSQMALLLDGGLEQGKMLSFPYDLCNNAK